MLRTFSNINFIRAVQPFGSATSLVKVSKPLSHLDSRRIHPGAYDFTFRNLGPRKFSKIPGPLNFPFVGAFRYGKQLAKANETGTAHLLWPEWFKKFGPLVRLELPGFKMVLMKNPGDIRSMYSRTEDNPRRDAMKPVLKIRRTDAHNLFNKEAGILAEQGSEWWRVRKLVQKTFMAPRNIATFLPHLDEDVHSLLDRMVQSGSENTYKFENIGIELKMLGLQSIVKSILGVDLELLKPGLSKNSYGMRLFHKNEAYNHGIVSMELFSSSAKFWKSEEFLEFTKSHDEYIKITKEKLDEVLKLLPNDPYLRDKTILGMLMKVDGLKMTDVTTVVYDLISGGVDNTAYCMQFTLYHLAKNPDCQRKLQEEIDNVLKEKDTIGLEEINEMAYLYRVIRESLRIHGIIFGNSRLLNKEEVIAGYLMPKNTLLLGVHDVIAKDERQFTQADKFIPDRWDKRSRHYDAIHPYASIPFSFGTRMCLGRRIAMNEMSVFLIRLLQKYSVTLDPAEVLDVTSRVILKPKRDLNFTFTRRN